MRRPPHYNEYLSMPEIVPGVFADDDGVYIVDDQGEVCCWTGNEWDEDREAIVATITAVALAAAKGSSAVRQNIADRGETLTNLLQETQDLE